MNWKDVLRELVAGDCGHGERRQTQEETVYLFRDSPAQALTDGEMSLLASHGEGGEMKGAWLYFAGESPR